MVGSTNFSRSNCSAMWWIISSVTLSIGLVSGSSNLLNWRRTNFSGCRWFNSCVAVIFGLHWPLPCLSELTKLITFILIIALMATLHFVSFFVLAVALRYPTPIWGLFRWSTYTSLGKGYNIHRSPSTRSSWIFAKSSWGAGSVQTGHYVHKIH